MCYFRGLKNATDSEYDLIIRIAIDSVSSRTITVMILLLNAKDPLTTRQISVKSSLPENTIKRVLQDLNLLQVIDRNHHGFTDDWKLTKSYKVLLLKSGLYFNLKRRLIK